MSRIRTLSLSLSLAASSAMASDRPAVRMLPAKPMDAVEVLTARAAPGGFDPFPATPPRNNAARIRTMFDKSKAFDEPEKEPGNWTKFTKWVDERTQAIKKRLNGPPEQQPPPRVASNGQASLPPQKPLRKFFESMKTPDTPEAPKVSAASPAYRWYGYGTVTPGANTFAPAGDYPHGSAQWYSQTGATPGAFPVPTMNPYRAVPGAEPPTYIPPPPAIPTTTTTPLPSTPVMSRKTIAETPYVPAFTPNTAVPVPPSMPANWRPKMEPKPVLKVEPQWKPATATEPVKPFVDPSWKPAETTIVPVIRGQVPTFDDSPLKKKILAACQGLVTDVTIRETGPGQLTIAFQATTTTLAEIAVRAMSNIVELKPFTVDFAGKVSQ